MANLGIEIKRKCPICGKVFIIKTLDSVYCSPKCSKVANKRKKDKEKKEALFVTYAQNVPDIREYLIARQVVTRAESTVLKVEMTDECLNTIKSARTELIKAETTLLANHRRMMLQEIRNQNKELLSLIKSGKGVYLPPKVFWWWAGITYFTSLYSLWCLLQLILQWLKC